MRIGTALVLGSIALFPTPSFAQTSSATIVSDTEPSDVTPPTPAKPLIVPDTNYPLESLLANEEGHTVLKVLIDSQGRITSVQRADPSGSARLGQGATLLARTQWAFRPAMKDGQPVDGSLNIDVDWKLPLRPADELYSDMMGFSVVGKRIQEPTHLSSLDKLTSRDYPAASVQRNEQGEVAVKVLVSELGQVAEVALIDSSGFSRLDEAALSIIKERFHYSPGSVDGRPMAMSYNVMFNFAIGTRPGDRPPIFCHSKPILGQATRMGTNGASGAQTIDEWIHISGNKVDDVVVRTKGGWMHFSAPMVQAISAAMAPSLAPPTARPAPSTGSLIRPELPKRPESCWYNAPANAGRT